jgi:hypothetical protein
METLLDTLAALFALGAAAFWFLSAYGELPPMLSYWDATPANDPFTVGIKYSAKMNRWAAALSGLSAVCVPLKLLAQHLS